MKELVKVVGISALSLLFWILQEPLTLGAGSPPALPQSTKILNPTFPDIGNVIKGECVLHVWQVRKWQSARIASMKSACMSFELAYSYGGPIDFLRLVESIAVPPLTDEMKSILLKKEGSTVSFYFRNADDVQQNLPGSPVKYVPPAQKDTCETIDFFGIRLNCFNAVGSKPENLQAIIAPLLFLKRASSVNVFNPITNGPVNPFQFIVDKKVEFIDATDYASDWPAAASQFGFGSFKYCNTSNGPAAEYFSLREINNLKAPITNRPMDSRGLFTAPLPPELKGFAFVCGNDGASSEEKKIEHSGILYHEANHVFGGHGHFYVDGSGQCKEALEVPNPLELDLKSLFGAHVYYLFDESQNTALTNEERCTLYKRAVAEWNWPRFCPGVIPPIYPNPCQE